MSLDAPRDHRRAAHRGDRLLHGVAVHRHRADLAEAGPMALLGFVVRIGIALNNGIILIDP